MKIGLPLGPGERVNSHVWQRQYEKAQVVVNLPGAADSYELKLNQPARDVLTGETGTSFKIPPGDGRILCRLTAPQQTMTRLRPDRRTHM